MEIIILILIIISIITNIVLFIRLKRPSHDNLDFLERLGRFEVNITKEFGTFKNDLEKDMNNNFLKVNDKLELKLNEINNKVNTRIDENFEKTNKTFINVLERLSKIDEAQKKIENLSVDIVSLENILTDKKTRGIFGEVNLYNILKNVFGEKNDLLYKTQYKLSNGYIADSVIFAPEPLRTIAIDSKFPLEAYRIMVDKNKSELERDMASKQFKTDMKHHIDAISSKYIIPGITSDQAIMFLPAEAIFAEVNAYYQDVIEYAYKKRVWIVSPTTLISTLTTIQVIMTNIEKDKYASVIHKELNLLSEEFGRYKERWDKLSRSIETVTKDVRDINTTTTKITKRFESINQVKLDNKDESVN